MASDKDLLSQLLETSYKGISFPSTSVDININHDVVEHRRMDRNGAKLENTGLEPFSFNVVIPFCNGLARGPNETWDKLYPDTYLKFLDVVVERTTGDFIHPEVGLRRCKIKTAKSILDPNYRNGTVLSVTFVEDTEEDDVALTKNATIDVAATAAVDLDNAIANLNPPIDTGLELDGFKLFSDFVNAIQGIFDQAGLLQQQIIGKIDRVVNKINKLSESVDNAFEAFGTAPDLLIESLLEIKKNALLNEAKQIGYYQVVKKITLLQLQLMFLNSPQELLSLNPDLANKPTIPAYTVIRYYKKT